MYHLTGLIVLVSQYLHTTYQIPIHSGLSRNKFGWNVSRFMSIVITVIELISHILRYTVDFAH